MFRILCLPLVLSLLLIACSGGSDSGAVNPAATMTVAVPVTDATPTVAASPTTAPTATEAPLPTDTPAPVVEAEPTQAPQSAPPPASGSVLNVSSTTFAYSVTRATVQTGATVTVNYVNNHAATPHDLSFSWAVRPPCNGPCTDSYSFQAPVSGTYKFYCTAHTYMSGVLIVTP